MRFWERFSKIIYKTVALRYLQKFQDYPIETVLRLSTDILDADTIKEVKSYVIDQQTVSGAFADKAGRGDLYYTLFGCFVTEALGITETLPGLKRYVREIVQRDELSGVHLHCAALLYAKLFGPEALTADMRNKIQTTIGDSGKNEGYTGFLNVLTCYYVEDYKGLNTVRKQIEVLQNNPDAPCPVSAAMLVLQHSFNKPADQIEKRLRSFYRNDGSYAAVRQAPTGDLLSTAVALYALGFAKADIRIMKPDCLAYVDSLYTGGGFCGTPYDDIPDIEYTFYGLLALGALSTAS